jgi:hypothetical protein
MPYLTLHRKVALATIIILLVILTDGLFLPPRVLQQVYSTWNSYETRTRRSSSYDSYFVQSTTGKQFQIPVGRGTFELYLAPGDTFYVRVSPIFRRPKALEYVYHGRPYGWQMGILRTIWGKMLVGYILAVSVLTLLPWQWTERSDLYERITFSGCALLGLLLFFYIYQ